MSVLGNKDGEPKDRRIVHSSSGQTDHSTACGLIGQKRLSVLQQMLHGMR